MALSVKERAGGSHASQLTRQLKTKITIVRDFMEESAIHLKAYEGFLDGIEGELREFIHSQRQLYNVDADSWQEMREFLPQCDADFFAA